MPESTLVATLAEVEEAVAAFKTAEAAHAEKAEALQSADAETFQACASEAELTHAALELAREVRNQKVYLAKALLDQLL